MSADVVLEGVTAVVVGNSSSRYVSDTCEVPHSAGSAALRSCGRHDPVVTHDVSGKLELDYGTSCSWTSVSLR